MQQRGFTLVEMLVVALIIGILGTTVVMTLRPSPQRTLQTEARRLAALLETANAEALAGQRQLAWQAHVTGYDFLLADDTADNSLDRLAAPDNDAQPRWLPIGTTADMFRSRQFDDAVFISQIEVDGRILQTGDLLVFRRGDPPLFRIVLGSRTGGSPQEVRLQGLPNGRVSVRASP
ncbi:MAG: prepilin-type N-terminal cleavage/methylation domain-containing protein [Sterolibacterium sp.]|nr:prepilin-type N-terminal cleavage/methylation domain-containing protein [Sterolibacterium sp.]